MSGDPSRASFHDLALSFTLYNPRGSERFQLEQLMTLGFFRGPKVCRLGKLRRDHADQLQQWAARQSPPTVSDVLQTTEVNACKKKAGGP